MELTSIKSAERKVYHFHGILISQMQKPAVQLVNNVRSTPDIATKYTIEKIALGNVEFVKNIFYKCF